MKKLQRLMAVVLVTALIAGSTGACLKREMTAQAKSNTFLLKAASDFKLRLPNSWKNKYVVKKSKGKKAGSYVAFYAKKCYRQTGEGWLFTIARYKDTSYEEMPSYELVGKWKGMHYVALYPTDVQIMGATKAAKKQYQSLNKNTEKVACSIQP